MYMVSEANDSQQNDNPAALHQNLVRHKQSSQNNPSVFLKQKKKVNKWSLKIYNVFQCVTLQKRERYV